MEFRNIALSGRIGVGTTTLAKALSSKLGWPLRDASQIFRDISLKSGFDLEKNPQTHADDVDKRVDSDSLSTLKSVSHVVVASKLAGFLSRDIPHTLRVLVTCPLVERIRRYAGDRGYDRQRAHQLLELREQKDQEKWEHLYGKHDFFDPSFFHLVLDSQRLSVDEEVKKILVILACPPACIR